MEYLIKEFNDIKFFGRKFNEIYMSNLDDLYCSVCSYKFEGNFTNHICINSEESECKI